MMTRQQFKLVLFAIDIVVTDVKVLKSDMKIKSLSKLVVEFQNMPPLKQNQK